MSGEATRYGGPVLAAASALVGLLAGFPELTAMPLRWQVDEDNGLSVTCLEHEDPHGEAYAAGLASALGVKVGRTEYVAERDGRAMVCLSVYGDVGPVLVSFTAFVVAGPAAVGGA